MVWNHSSRVVASAQDKKDQDQVSCDWSTARGGRVLWRTFQVTTTRDRPFFVSTPILRAFQFTQNPMANHDDKNDNHDESSPLLGRQTPPRSQSTKLRLRHPGISAGTGGPPTDCLWGTGAWWASRWAGPTGTRASSLVLDAPTSSVAAILKFVSHFGFFISFD
jgi:hypothetical protein